MDRFLFSVLFFWLNISGFAQVTVPVSNSPGPYKIGGVIQGQSQNKIYLLSVIGGKTTVLDSSRFDSNNLFLFEFPEPLPAGFYQLIVPQKEPIDIIVSLEPVFFKTTIHHLRDSINVVSSLETRLFYQLVNLERPINAKISALRQVVNLYAVDTIKVEFKKTVSMEIWSLQQEFNQQQEEMIRNYSDTFLAKLLQMNKQPSLDIHPELYWKYSDNTQFLREHYFDYINFSDERILRSNLLPTKYSGYLNLVPQQTADEYLNAIQYILAVTAENPAIYEWTVGYLLDSFQKSDYDEVFFYLSDIYGSIEGCQNEDLSFDLEVAKQTRKRLAPGNVAPDINLPGVDNLQYALSSTEGKYTLLFFWASWCPHCMQALAKIVELYNKYQPAGFAVYAVSIDQEKQSWEDAIQSHRAFWTNVSELKGWKSGVVELYNVRATPTCYLLDKEKKIVKRFMLVDQLEEELAKIF
ncbi:redoxin domain-containing protein [candidate division KSB1 bacterium]|nr:redoxin domain-containing protein [candidate division KSB1 bacterium]